LRGWLAAVVVLSACRAEPRANGGDDTDTVIPDAPALFDAPDGTGCTPTTPRTAAPESFYGPEGLEDHLGSLLDVAEHTLALQMYLFDDPVLRDRVIAAKQRGVDVRVLLDPGEHANAAIAQAFVQQGIATRNTPPIYSYSHAKYFVIDDEIGVIMSMNFNTGAMNYERNYGFIDQDPDDVADLMRIFTMDWAAAGNQTPRPANLACTRLIVSPDNSRQRVLDFIGGAKTTLDVEAMYVTDSSVSSAIVAAAQRGVVVRVMLEDPAQQDGNQAVANAFAADGIPVHFATDQFFLHAKLLVADGVAFVGSENYSTTSLTQNREVGALLIEPDAVAPIQAQYEADWAATAP
jgi:phosphatidylserine/phosphatidylglycerophosphate/cardiolipin synthase-like enzyme